MSQYLTFQGNRQDELESLHRVLSLCRKSHIGEVIYIVSQDVCRDEGSDAILLRAAEELCTYYREKNWVPVTVIRCPYLIGGNVPSDYWYQVFQGLEEKGSWVFRTRPEELADFVDMADIAEFLRRLFDEGIHNNQVLELHGSRSLTFQEVAQWLKEQYPYADIRFEGWKSWDPPELGENQARSKLGWFPKVSMAESLEECRQEYRSRSHGRKKQEKSTAKRLFSYGPLVVGLELAGGALLVEILQKILGSSFQFKMIDVRLLFVVCMASVYGMNTGMIAAFLEMLSLTVAYYKEGMNGMLLFYEPSNWLPFLLYMVAGAVCGYIHGKAEEDVASLQADIRIRQEKYDFLSQLYEEALKYKNQYKRQIVGSRDSFGRIFDVVRRLDATMPEEIFATSIPVLEDVLENQSISIYSIHSPEARFGRLEVCSHGMEGILDNSIELEQYQEIIETVKTGEVWFNRDMAENLPVYIAGCRREGTLILLIMVHRVEYIQAGMYYANLIRILCGLIENAFVKAWEYQKVLLRQTHVEDTMIVNEAYMVEQLRIRHSMQENQLARYRLLQILPENKSLKELDRILRTRIRGNDLMGLGNDGNLYLLMPQVDEKGEKTVLERFRKLGLTCGFVEKLEGA